LPRRKTSRSTEPFMLERVKWAEVASVLLVGLNVMLLGLPGALFVEVAAALFPQAGRKISPQKIASGYRWRLGQAESGTCWPTVKDEAGVAFFETSSALWGAMMAATSAAMVSSKATSSSFKLRGSESRMHSAPMI
jgi:hypothetical protein